MKQIYLSCASVLLLSVACSQVKLNSRDNREQKVADSLRVVDSVRVADSAKTAESLLLDRYALSDKEFKDNQKQKMEQRIQDSIARTNNDASDDYSEKQDGPLEVVIDEKSPYAPQINILQAKIDSINSLLYDNDSKYRKMKDYSLKDKKAYLQYLIFHHQKDTSEVLKCCQMLYESLQFEQKKLDLILKTQQGNGRSVISLYIRKTRNEAGEISQLILSLSPSVPTHIEHVGKHELASD